MGVVILRVVVRVVGTLAGILGLVWIGDGVAALFLMFRDQPSGAIGPFVSLAYFVMGSYFTYVAYLVWRRLSRRAFLHVSVVLVVVGPTVLRWVCMPGERGSLWLICLGAALVFYWVSSRWMFPAEGQ